jgi:hypothetical protein
MGVFLNQFETISSTALRYEESTMPAKLKGKFPALGSLLTNCNSHAPRRVNRDCNPLLIFL